MCVCEYMHVCMYTTCGQCLRSSGLLGTNLSALNPLSHLSNHSRVHMDTTASLLKVLALGTAWRCVTTQASQRQLCLEGSGDSCVDTALVPGALFSTLLSAWLVNRLGSVVLCVSTIELSLESLKWGLVRSLKPVALLGEKRLGQLGLREAGSMSFLENRLLRNMVNT